jgi:hypothetical protein
MFSALCLSLALTAELQVVLALVKHTAPILSNEEWHQAMCTKSDTARFDELIDILSDVSALLAEMNTLISGSNNSILNWRATLLHSLLSLADRLDTWQCGFRSIHSKAPFWAVHSNIHNPTDDAFKDKLFPFSIEFESLDTAILFVLCWGAMLEVLGAILRLYNFFFASLDRPPTLEALLGYGSQESQIQVGILTTQSMPSSKFTSILDIKAETDRLARLLCQCMEFCHRIEMGTLGPQATCYVQWAIQSYFRWNAGYERELSWALNIKNMRGPGSRCGIELMTFQD